MKYFSDMIKKAAKSKGLTISDLANKLNISQGALSQKINGNITVNSLREIAIALDISLPDLLAYGAGLPVSDTSTQSGKEGLTCPICGAPLDIKIQSRHWHITGYLTACKGAFIRESWQLPESFARARITRVYLYLLTYPIYIFTDIYITALSIL